LELAPGSVTIVSSWRFELVPGSVTIVNTWGV
jgi:hypothetical protein